MSFFDRLIKSTQSSLLWVKALNASHKRRDKLAISIMMKIRNISTLQPYHLAFLGTEYVLDKNSGAAKPVFIEARDRTNGKSDPESRYINLYSQIYLIMIDNDKPAGTLIDEAEAIACKPILKRWLPLSPAGSRNSTDSGMFRGHNT